MKFNEYQRKAKETAIYPGTKTIMGLAYVALGLNGEAGEIAEKVKKIMRDDNFIYDDKKKQELKKELGDVLWYLAMACEELDCNISDIAEMNLNKLNDRKKEGKLNGSGDNR